MNAPEQTNKRAGRPRERVDSISEQIYELFALQSMEQCWCVHWAQPIDTEWTLLLFDSISHEVALLVARAHTSPVQWCVDRVQAIHSIKHQTRV